MAIWYAGRNEEKNINGFVYIYVDVEVFSGFIVKRFLKSVTKVKSYMNMLG
jgi:hypothetical protein